MTNTDILNQDPVLAEIVQRLIRDFSPKRVFLFGSRARGDAGESSDYDILLVVSASDVPGYRLAQKAHRYTLQGIPAPVDVVIITEQVFQAKKAVIGTLSETAVHEGKELYAA
jgi:predicted nucleotidyltransferase